MILGFEIFTLQLRHFSADRTSEARIRLILTISINSRITESNVLDRNISKPSIVNF